MRSLPLFTLSSLRTTISPFGLACFLVSVPLLAWPAAKLLSLTFVPALGAGLLSAIVLFFSEWMHQWGHARAARSVGHPMTGIHFNSLFSISVYPPDESQLPPRIHIRRALGGFWINIIIGAALAPVAIFLWPRGGVWAWVTVVGAVYDFVAIGVGALLPIDIPGVFTIDGGTLWRYWRELKRG